MRTTSLTKINFLLFLSVFLCSLFSYAHQPSFKGSTQFADGSKASFISVTIEELGKNVLTDEQGEFELMNVPFGHYTIHFSSFEIVPYSAKIHFTQTEKRHAFDLKRSSGAHLDEMVIAVQTDKTKLETQGYAVNVIETQKIGVQSIQTNDLLNRVAGVNIRQDGGLGSNVNYSINGMSGNAVRILIDGVPISNYGSSFSLSSIPPALIQRVEVYKGVVPPHLAEDALGGAINIVLKKEAGNSLSTSYSYGSFNTHQWNMTGSMSTSKGFTANGSAFYNYSDNDYQVWGKSIAFKDHEGNTYPYQKAKRFHDAYRSYGGKVEAGFTDVKWADKLMIGAVYAKDYKEIQHGITMDLVYGNRHTRRNTKVGTLTYQKEDFITKGLTVNVDASYSMIERQVIDTVGYMYDWSGKPIQRPDGTYVLYNSGAEVASQKTLGVNKDNTLMTRLALGYVLNEHHSFHVYGLYNDFKRKVSDELQAQGLQKLQNTRDLTKEMLSFSYENLAFQERLRTTLFYKHYFQKVVSKEPVKGNLVNGVQQYTVNKTTKNIDYNGYGVTLAYTVTPRFYLLGSLENALRLPSANELFGNESDNLLSSIALKPERSLNINLGFNWDFLETDQHFAKLYTTFVYRDTKDMIRQAIKPGSSVFSQYENLEDVLGKGVDVELTYVYNKKLNVVLNISKIKSAFNTKYDSSGAPYGYYKMQIRNEPTLKANLNVSYDFEDVFLKKSLFSVYYNLRYVDKFYRDWRNVGGANLQYIPEQVINDLGFTYTLPNKRVTVSFDAKNIFNQQVFDNFGLQKPGKAFYGKVTYSL